MQAEGINYFTPPSHDLVDDFVWIDSEESDGKEKKQNNQIIQQRDRLDSEELPTTEFVLRWSEEDAGSALYREEETKKLDQPLNTSLVLLDSVSIFHRSAALGRVDPIRAFLQSRGDIDTRNPEGISALHIAAKYGHLNVVQSLYNQHADLSTISSDGCNIWHFAAANGHVAIINWLSVPYLQKGPYMEEFPDPTELTSFLAVNNAGHTPLYLAIKHEYQGATESLRKLVEQLAITYGIYKDRELSMLLYLGIANGDITIVKKALAESYSNSGSKYEAALDINRQSYYQPLNEEALKAITFDNRYLGYKALQRAVQSDHVHILEFLLSIGLLPPGNLLDTCQGTTLLQIAAERGHFRAVKFLHENKADIHKQNPEGRTAVHYALLGNNVSIVQYLMESKGNIHQRDKQGVLPIHLAAQKGIKELKMLLQKKRMIEEACKKGCTAVHYAAKGGQLECLKLLQACKANLFAKDRQGNNALNFAKGYAQLIDWLTKQGLSTNQTTIGEAL